MKKGVIYYLTVGSLWPSSCFVSIPPKNNLFSILDVEGGQDDAPNVLVKTFDGEIKIVDEVELNQAIEMKSVKEVTEEEAALILLSE
jgi:hypothetical protein